jgi:hypothetical protein
MTEREKPSVWPFRLAALVLVAAGAFGVATWPSCTRDGDDDGRRVTLVAEPDDVLSEQLMLYLAEAKNLHRIADVYLGDANLADAITAVTKILAIPIPAHAPEAEDARMDARARLAKLQVLAGKVDDAARSVDEGLAEATRPSFFVANLHTVKGEVLEARAALIDPKSDPPDGDAAQFRAYKKAAIEAYEASNRMLEALQKRLHERTPTGAPGAEAP